MRLVWIAMLALGACTETADDDDNPLLDLLAQNQIECGHSSFGCYAAGTAAPVAACMNDALATGARAQAADTSYDRYGPIVTRYLFTVDGQVTVYVIHPTADPIEEPYTHSITTCGGPIRVVGECMPGGGGGGESLVVDGCGS